MEGLGERTWECLGEGRGVVMGSLLLETSTWGHSVYGDIEARYLLI